MRNPKTLTRDEIERAARTLRPNRKISKWTVIVGGRELPARPLVLEAAGVPPNNPTNSHQAVAILERLGFETRYRDETNPQPKLGADANAQEYSSIAQMLAAITANVPNEEWKTLPTDLAKNLDHYLYGHKKVDE